MTPKPTTPRCMACQALWEHYTRACEKFGASKEAVAKKAAEHNVREAAKAYLAHRRSAHGRRI